MKTVNIQEAKTHHRDPIDRVVVAQALAHGLRVATRDPLIPKYGVSVLLV